MFNIILSWYLCHCFERFTGYMKRAKLLLCCLCVYIASHGQQENEKTIESDNLEQRVLNLEKSAGSWKNLKISGYIQSQYQHGEKDASLQIGSENENPEESFNRIGIRRGRLKFTYDEGVFSGIFQLDITEKTVALRDVYIEAKDGWLETSSSLRFGVYPLPFGHEISRSSSKRESPERAKVIETLFPDMRDLGALLHVQPAASSPFHFLQLDLGLFAGNGIQKEIDSKRDFTGRLSAQKGSRVLNFNAGFSYYRGSIYQGSENVFTMKDKSFSLNNDPSNRGKFAKREYFGFDGQVAAQSIIGKSELSAEYLFGQQPAMGQHSESHSASVLPVGDTYIRDFRGGYLMFVQSLGTLPVSAVVKYDWYDPNTKISKDEAGLNGTGAADIAVNNLGFGAIWTISKPLRAQAYYQISRNEKSFNIPYYSEDRKDNLFTLRLQYSF